jgi:hypothetical protein
MPRKSILYIVILFFLSGGFLYAQNYGDLSVTLQDIRFTKDGKEGYHLYVRKKPAIDSVMAMFFLRDAPDESFAYRAREWNEVNGNESFVVNNPGTYTGHGFFVLIDSTPEIHPELGEAFHIFFPPLLDYGFDETPNGTIWIGEEVPINVRCFARPYGDDHGGYQDNHFIMVYDDSGIIVMGTYNTGFQKTIPPLTIEGWMGFALFAPGPDGYIDDTLQINSNSTINGALSVKIPINGTWGVNTGFERDMILLNRFYARAMADFGFIGFEAGFFLGVLNFNPSRVDPGLTLVVSARSPSTKFFGSVRGDLGLNRSFSNTDDYTQDLVEAEFGARVPYTILRANIDFHQMTVRTKRRADSNRKWTRYVISGETDFASPWAFRLNLGYQTLFWDYETSPAWDYNYDSFFVGLGASWKVLPNLKLSLGLEAPIYPFVYPDIGDFDDPQKPVLLGFTLGAVWSLR